MDFLPRKAGCIEMAQYPDAELTWSIIGAAFEVYNVLGAGFLEKV